MLVNCGIRRVFFREKYDDQMTLDFFNDAGIELVQINMETDNGRAEV